MKTIMICATLAGSVVGLGLGDDLRKQIKTCNREVELGQSAPGASFGVFKRTVARLIAGGDC